MNLRLPSLSGRPSVLLVCTANLCRSPMAEGALRRLLQGSGIDLDSAGTHDFGVGLAPHPLAVAAARRRGYDISRLVGRQVRTHDFRYFDMIVAMDHQHVADLRASCPANLAGKIVRLLDFDFLSVRRDVKDPIGGNARDFDACLRQIEGGCAALARHIEAQQAWRSPERDGMIAA